MTRLTRDEWALSLAHVTSLRSTCLRRRVGCVLLNGRGHVLATGYNGVAAGQPHCNEVTGAIDNPALMRNLDGTARLTPRIAEHWERATVEVRSHACSGASAPSGTALDACHAIHAEQNALLQCRDVYAIQSAYITASPCTTCVKLLLNTSCERIVFTEAYPHQEAEKLWRAAGRVWEAVDLTLPTIFGQRARC